MRKKIAPAKTVRVRPGGRTLRAAAQQSNSAHAETDDATVYIFGAGASHGYTGSRTGISPPLATNFFSTFYRLLISQDFEVKIGDIVNYIRDTRGIDPIELPRKFDGNIEAVFSELHDRLETTIEKREPVPEIFRYSRTYDQFVFWFCHVLNEIQNGTPCDIYSSLVADSSANTTFITFNWDTILDRSLASTGRWHPDDGYAFTFDQLLENEWRNPRKTKSNWKLLKLHGSTNWLGPYVTLDLRDGTRKWLTSPERVNFNWCVIDGQKWFATYKDRWRPGYQPYSYFFPPQRRQGLSANANYRPSHPKQGIWRTRKVIFRPLV